MAGLTRRAAGGLLLAIALGLPISAVCAAPPARAAAETFGAPTATATFGQSVVFEQPVSVDGVAAAEVLVSSPSSLGPLVTPYPAPADGRSTLRHTIVTAGSHMYPNTRLIARWRLLLADGTTTLGPEVEVVYADERFDWQTVEEDIVRVHWYEGSEAFGRRTLRISLDAIAEAEALLGVEETEPIDFFVYADRAAFYDALGPAARENVGGTAVSSIRTMFALIGPGQIADAWVGIVIPHELTHLVFDTAVENPYHFPPRWLNEGVATYLTQGYDASERALVEQAADDGTLVPLGSLTGQFPTSREAFFLAYAESVSAVDYMIRTHGQDAVVELINSYAEGRTDDEAFSAALGLDAGSFDEAWFVDLGAEMPDRVGPGPAPGGPLPSGWSAAVSPTPGASPVPSASSPPMPSAGVSAAPSPTAGPNGGATGDGSVALTAAVFLLLAVAVVGIGVVVFRRRTRRSGTAGPAPSDRSDSSDEPAPSEPPDLPDPPGPPATPPGPGASQTPDP